MFEYGILENTPQLLAIEMKGEHPCKRALPRYLFHIPHSKEFAKRITNQRVLQVILQHPLFLCPNIQILAGA